MSEFNMKEVRFDNWCHKCIYFDVDDAAGGEPCNECLAETAREHTTKPLKCVLKSSDSGSNR